jgi:hypothetical protein
MTVSSFTFGGFACGWTMATGAHVVDRAVADGTNWLNLVLGMALIVGGSLIASHAERRERRITGGGAP